MVQITARGSSDRIRSRRRSILRTASRAFGEKGFHAAGMREIAAATGMRVGNLYYYFENKEALLAFCQEETVTRLLELAAWVEERNLRADGRLYQWIVGHVVCINEGVPASLAHLEVERLGPRLRKRVVAKRDRYERSLRELLAEGVRERVFRDVDVKLASSAILGAVNWTVKWYREGGGLSAREIGEGIAESSVRGLLHPGVRFRPPTTPVPLFDGAPEEDPDGE
jgi:AcrR family transcriptional regulator